MPNPQFCLTSYLRRFLAFGPALFGCFLFHTYAQEPGSLDPLFAAQNQPDGLVGSVLAGPGQTIYIAGDFRKLGQTPRGRIARLQQDGSIDPSFDPGEGFNGQVYSMALQGDGKILVGGPFTSYNNSSARYLARLNADGSIDGTFQPALNNYVSAVVPLPNGDLLIGGAFAISAPNGSRQFLARLHSDGTLDPTFDSAINGSVISIALQSDGQILIGGDFTSVGGQYRGRIARVAGTNGALDRTFDSGAGANRSVYAIAPLPDGGILVGGQFDAFNGVSEPYLARLLANGLPDLTFQASLNSYVYALALQSDGRIIVGGEFTDRVARLRKNGALDATFDPGTGANTTVWRIMVQSNGDLIVGGSFTDLNGTGRSYLARLVGLKLASGGELNFDSSSYLINENQANLSIDVRRTGNLNSSVTVDIATSSTGAANGANAGDYVPKTETLTFAAGETKKTFNIIIRQDTTIEDDETFNITLSNPSGGAALGIETTAQVTIQSDDTSTLPGSVDASFGVGMLGAAVSALSLTPEGKIVVGGTFQAVAGQSRYNIARLEDSGAPDSTFKAGAWTDSAVYALATQDDGKLLLGGAFGVVNGISSRYLARLNQDGSFDPSFNPGSGPNNQVYALLSMAFGDLLVGGAFSSFNGTSSGSLVKVFTDGSLDPTFNPQIDGAVYAILRQPDGKFIIGGEFSRVGGLRRFRIARLNSDGSVDTTFDPAYGADGAVRALALQSDGQIIIGGSFSTVNLAPWRYIARLTSSGLPDSTFTGAFSSTVYALAIQPDGRIVVGGDFPGRLTRLTPEGSADLTVSNIGSGADAAVSAIVLQSDGRLIAGGSFQHFGSFLRRGLVRVLVKSSAPAGELEFTSAVYTVTEGEPSVTLEVRRNGPTAQQASADYATISGTATAADFVSRSTRVTFAPGEAKKTITIQLKNDALFEDDESFTVTLSNPAAGTDLGARRTATVVIKNDDSVSGAGALDPEFVGNIDLGNNVQTMSVGADGSILVAGDFRAVNGQSRVNLVKFLPDGRLDQSFYPALWTDGVVTATLLQDDGRIILGGTFGTVSGTSRLYLARLNQDGSFDNTFNIGTGPNRDVNVLASSSEGDLYIGGGFSQFNGDANGQYLVKIYSDGSLDPTFSPHINNTVLAIALQKDGKILVGGHFTSIDGRLRNRIARLNQDGTTDLSFDPAVGPDSYVRTISIQADQKILIGGAFGLVNGFPQRYFARLLPNGLPDISFAPSFNGLVYASTVQSDGNILIGGDFTAHFARLLPTGDFDPAFQASPPPNGSVYALTLQSDGNVLAGGTFNQFNGLNRSLLARVQGLNDSGGGQFDFASSILNVPENQGTVAVEVRRTGNIDNAVTVDYTTSNGSANAGDYVIQNGTLIFGVGETRKTINIAIIQDTQPEDTESLTVALTNPTGGATLGSTRTTQINILNDDFFTAPGSVDLTLQTGSATGAGVNAIVTTPDGKILLGGDFRAIAGQSIYNLARLKSDGTPDTTFNSSLSFDGPIYALALQPDGKAILGGAFANISGVPRRFLARLNLDGTVDVTFDPGPGGNSNLNALYRLPNGDLLAGGSFSSYNGDNARIGLVKLFSDGTVDTTYNPRLNSSVYGIAQQPDGKILVGGDFTTISGQTRNRIARLNPDGSLDTSFDPLGGPNTTVRAISIQPDGKILIAGMFSVINGVSRTYLARLLPDGTIDQDFAPSLDSYVYALYLDTAGNIHIGGSFGKPQLYYAKLKPDGTLHPDSAASASLNSAALAITADSTGRILLGGGFTQIGQNLNRPFLVRLLGTDAPATPFRFSQLTYSGNSIHLTATGGPSASAVLEVSDDLRIWTPLRDVTKTEGKFDLNDSLTRTHRFYRLKLP